jgi:hypothetical protein
MRLVRAMLSVILDAGVATVRFMAVQGLEATLE